MLLAAVALLHELYERTGKRPAPTLDRAAIRTLLLDVYDREIDGLEPATGYKGRTAGRHAGYAGSLRRILSRHDNAAVVMVTTAAFSFSISDLRSRISDHRVWRRSTAGGGVAGRSAGARRGRARASASRGLVWSRQLAPICEGSGRRTVRADCAGSGLFAPAGWSLPPGRALVADVGMRRSTDSDSRGVVGVALGLTGAAPGATGAAGVVTCGCLRTGRRERNGVRDAGWIGRKPVRVRWADRRAGRRCRVGGIRSHARRSPGCAGRYFPLTAGAGGRIAGGGITGGRRIASRRAAVRSS